MNNCPQVFLTRDQVEAKKVSEVKEQFKLLYFSIMFLVLYLRSIGCKALLMNFWVVACNVSSAMVLPTAYLFANSSGCTCNCGLLDLMVEIFV